MSATQTKEVFLPRRGSRVSSVKSPQVVRSTVANSWRWIWRDVFMRIIPMGAIPFIYIALLHQPLSFLGLTLHDVPQQIAAWPACWHWHGRFCRPAIVCLSLAPGFAGPPQDQIVQSAFYLFINAPVEELFFRGFLLEVITHWTGSLGWGWLVSTAAYTLYHRLGKWNWRSVGGVGLAGIVFSLVYLLPSGPHTLLAVIIVHGFTTSGFLSWGDEVLYRRWKYRQSRTNV